MTFYTKGTLDDRDEIINLGDYAFGTDFKALLPKLYNDAVDTTSCHFIAKEEGKIQAMVGSFPLELNILNRSLKGFGIGTVCVHPEARGRGYMKQLMKNAMTEMYSEQADFAVLSGQKQRYEYFGFTPSGTQLCFTLTETNLRHKNIVATPSITFKSFDCLSTDALTQIYTLHHSRPLFSTRNLDDFIVICKSWKSTPFAIYHEGNLCGYIICTGNRIEDLHLTQTDLLIPILTTFMQTFSHTECFICLGSHEQSLMPSLLNLCESYQIQLSTCLNILNYQNFIKAFLEFKNSYAPLVHGQFILEIQDRAKLLIKVAESIEVTPTVLEPDMSLSHLEAIHFLCDPLQLCLIASPSQQFLTQSWFPLPFMYCSIDNV